jgi:hypothetical protein
VDALREVGSLQALIQAAFVSGFSCAGQVSPLARGGLSVHVARPSALLLTDNLVIVLIA